MIPCNGFKTQVLFFDVRISETGMNQHLLFNFLIIGWFGLSVISFLILLVIPVPYGRHIRHGWGVTVKNQIGWLVMEAPSPIIFFFSFILGQNSKTVTTIAFLVMWEMHYVHRAFIYPFRLRGKEKRMPVAIMILGFMFNIINSFFIGHYLFSISDGYPNRWLMDPRFIFGFGLFLVGFVINCQADYILCNLRRPGESNYKIPFGGLFRWISCPNYLGEIIEWVGWGVATWSLPSLTFSVWTAANLVPRSRFHHFWYHQHFPGYPLERKALIPGLW
ncbi:MAG: DUF1295 domain-containing protein [Candidatus Poribacteria bacterium]